MARLLQRAGVAVEIMWSNIYLILLVPIDASLLILDGQVIMQYGRFLW